MRRDQQAARKRWHLFQNGRQRSFPICHVGLNGHTQNYNSIGHFVGCRGMVVVQSPEILPVKRWEPNDYPARTSLCWKLGWECPGPVNCSFMSKSCGRVASCFAKWCGSQQQRQILSSSRPMAVSLSARAPIQHQLCCIFVEDVCRHYPCHHLLNYPIGSPASREPKAHD